MRIYCDSVILIYLLDTVGPFHVHAEARVTALRAAGDRAVVSDLSRLECRVKPLRSGDATSLAQFDAFFARADVEFVPLPSAVYERATVLRAVYNFKLGDALHLAAAIESGCDRFLTNDTRLSRCPDIPIEILP
jgi:predicted nucleic acid-binding protein